MLSVDKNIDSVPQLLMQAYTSRNDALKAQQAALHAYQLLPEEPLVVLMAAVATLNAVRGVTQQRMYLFIAAGTRGYGGGPQRGGGQGDGADGAVPRAAGAGSGVDVQHGARLSDVWPQPAGDCVV